MTATHQLMITLLLGTTGALGAAYAGLPAPAILGSTIAVTCGSLFRITRDIPDFLRNIAFTIIGCSLGSSITQNALHHAVKWPISLFILGIAVVAIMFSCSKVLVKYYGATSETALLATSPGALGFILALVSDGIGDIRSVVVIQSIRIVLVITTIPFILTHTGMNPELPEHTVIDSMGISSFCLILASSLLIGLLLDKLHLPAAFFLAGIFISGSTHFLGIISGPPAPEFTFIGFTITGSLVGARFSTIPRADLKKLFFASMSTVFLSMSIAAFFAALVSQLLSLPFGQVFVAFAPGGVEAMAAMAISLNYDPAFVAVHHLFRIGFLILMMPLFLKTSSLIKK